MRDEGAARKIWRRLSEGATSRSLGLDKNVSPPSDLWFSLINVTDRRAYVDGFWDTLPLFPSNVRFVHGLCCKIWKTAVVATWKDWRTFYCSWIAELYMNVSAGYLRNEREHTNKETCQITVRRQLTTVVKICCTQWMIRVLKRMPGSPAQCAVDCADNCVLEEG